MKETDILTQSTQWYKNLSWTEATSPDWFSLLKNDLTNTEPPTTEQNLKAHVRGVIDK